MMMPTWRAIADLANYLVSMGELVKLYATTPVLFALGFLEKFPLPIHALKPEIWKDIHQAVEFWGSIVVVSRLFC